MLGWCAAGDQGHSRDSREKCALSLCTKLEIFFWFRFLATAAAVTTAPVPSPGHPCNSSLSSGELFKLWCFHSTHSVLSPTNQTERGKTSIFQLVFPPQTYWADTSEHFLHCCISIVLPSVCKGCLARKIINLILPQKYHKSQSDGKPSILPTASFHCPFVPSELTYEHHEKVGDGQVSVPVSTADNFSPLTILISSETFSYSPVPKAPFSPLAHGDRRLRWRGALCAACSLFAARCHGNDASQ